MIIYHGSSGNLTNELLSNLQESKTGRLGQGAYFSKNIDVAKHIAKHRATQHSTSCM